MKSVYRAKYKKLAGTDFREVRKKVIRFYRPIRKRSRRKPYIRSIYFNKNKIFLNIFWIHLFDKWKWRDRMRRLRYFPAAIDLIEHNRFAPQSKKNPNKPTEILHRFSGITKDGFLFYVQIKERRPSRQKFLISIFPDS